MEIIIAVIMAFLVVTILEKFIVLRYDVWNKLESKINRKILLLLMYSFFIISLLLLDNLFEEFYSKIILWGIVFPMVCHYQVWRSR